jgi:hypothetical protein
MSFKYGHNTRKHGQSPEYRVWSSMITRTTNLNRKTARWYSYVKCCDRWLNSFEAFLAYMGVDLRVRLSVAISTPEITRSLIVLG